MSVRVVLYTLAVVCFLIWAVDFHIENRVSGTKIAVAEQSQVAALVAPFASELLVLDAREKTAGCQIQGPLPDHACTPGAVFASATPSIICVSGYTKTVRSVSTTLKKQLYAAYGILYPEPTGSYELDHLIPLELGGSNDAANLFPEAATPAPGFHEKDLVENYLHNEVCAGDMALPAAQRQIATNWLAVYEALSPETIAALKRQYTSWSN